MAVYRDKTCCGVTSVSLVGKSDAQIKQTLDKAKVAAVATVYYCISAIIAKKIVAEGFVKIGKFMNSNGNIVSVYFRASAVVRNAPWGGKKVVRTKTQDVRVEAPKPRAKKAEVAQRPVRKADTRKRAP